jgi:hypothetical protein
MITELSIENNLLQQVLSLLQDSTFNFQLTGSRYFNTANENSDYDFFVQYSYEVRNFLAGNSFDEKWHDYGDDPEIEVVFQHRYVPVHIQLVKNFDRKMKVQSALFISGASNHLKDKLLAKFIWNLGFHLVPVKEKSVQASYLFKDDALNAVRSQFYVGGSFFSRPNLRDDKIQAIKLYRLLTGAGLKESKDAVESLL